MSYQYQSRDGLLQSNDPAAVQRWDTLEVSYHERRQVWTKILRDQGIKYAHPDDGWVDRVNNVHTSCYPQFNDDPQVGDLIAFGSPPERAVYLANWDHPNPKHQCRDRPEAASHGYRICEVTRIENQTLLIHSTIYHYRDTGQRIPPRDPTKE